MLMSWSEKNDKIKNKSAILFVHSLGLMLCRITFIDLSLKFNSVHFWKYYEWYQTAGKLH